MNSELCCVFNCSRVVLVFSLLLNLVSVLLLLII